MEFRRRLPAEAIDEPHTVSGSRIPLWLPWLAAPAFMLLPMVGCGAAASLRHAEIAQDAGQIEAPLGAIVTVVRSQR